LEHRADDAIGPLDHGADGVIGPYLKLNPMFPMNKPFALIDLDDLASCVREEITSALDAAIPHIGRLVNQKEILTDEELSELTGYSKRALAYRRKDGSLPYIKRGRRILYRTADIHDWLNAGRVDRSAVRHGAGVSSRSTRGVK
jgi:Helix-turn-helix domain